MSNQADLYYVIRPYKVNVIRLSNPNGHISFIGNFMYRCGEYLPKKECLEMFLVIRNDDLTNVRFGIYHNFNFDDDKFWIYNYTIDLTDVNELSVAISPSGNNYNLEVFHHSYKHKCDMILISTLVDFDNKEMNEKILRAVENFRFG